MMVAAELPFRPHNDRGSIRAFVLAAVIHCLLFAFLYFGISWTNQPPAPAQADLWASLPPMASPQPRVVTPPPKPVVDEPKPEPPPPVKADIEQKIEKKKPEPVKPPPPPKKEEVKKPPPPKPEPPPKVQPKVEKSPTDEIQAALAKETRNKDLKDMSNQAAKELGSAGANGAADAWLSRVGAMVRDKVPSGIANAVPGNPTAIFEITLLPGREVDKVTLVQSSGNPAYDEAAKQAIQATSPLPAPTPGMPPIGRTLRFKARPKDQ